MSKKDIKNEKKENTGAAGTAVEETPPETAGMAKGTETVKVVFLRTYVGKLGNFHKDKTYEITEDLYHIFRDECERVK